MVGAAFLAQAASAAFGVFVCFGLAGLPDPAGLSAPGASPDQVEESDLLATPDLAAGIVQALLAAVVASLLSVLASHSESWLVVECQTVADLSSVADAFVEALLVVTSVQVV